MAKDERRFVIVPREVLTDEQYATVRANRSTLGTWLMLYLEADVLWPVAPSIPRWVPDDELAALETSGLLVVAGDRYRLAIVDESRSRAKAKAENAAAARWGDADSNAPSDAPSIAPSNAREDAQPMPTQTQTNTQTQNGSLSSAESHSARDRVGRVNRPKVRGFTSPLEGGQA